jgi:ATP-dependent protease ClpP protease subunit
VKAPDPDFTPNPKRAIHIQGVIDQDMIYRLTPRIIALQGESRKPITAYIDSPGGDVENKSKLLRLLASGTQNSTTPCTLITVALSLAGSAAADFLSAGFYALAYPQSLIMYHGVRGKTNPTLTADVGPVIK